MVDDDNDNTMTGLDVGNVIMILISQAHCFQKMFKPSPYTANSYNLHPIYLDNFPTYPTCSNKNIDHPFHPNHDHNHHHHHHHHLLVSCSAKLLTAPFLFLTPSSSSKDNTPTTSPFSRSLSSMIFIVTFKKLRGIWEKKI